MGWTTCYGYLKCFKCSFIMVKVQKGINVGDFRTQAKSETSFDFMRFVIGILILEWYGGRRN